MIIKLEERTRRDRGPQNIEKLLFVVTLWSEQVSNEFFKLKY